MLQLMMDRPDAQIALQAFERRFDLRQLHVSIPQHGRIFRHQVRAQQIVAVTPLGLFQPGLIQLKSERLARHFLRSLRQVDFHESEKPAPHPSWPHPRASVTDRASGNSAASRATSATAAPASSAASPSLWPAALHFWPARITRHGGQTASPAPIRALDATAVPAIASHTPGSSPATCPPDKTSPAATFAFPAAGPRSGFPGPSPTPAALYRTGFRCGPESRATSSSPTCCRPSLRSPAVVPPASRSARPPHACSPV